MTYFLALIGAIAGAAVGASLGVSIAGILAPMLGISSFEGASGYFAVYIGGPIGGLLGLLLGAVIVLRMRGQTGFGAISGRIGLVVLGVVAVVAAGIGVLYLSQDILNPNGAAPQLAFEIRLPAGAVPPSGADRPIELTTSKNRMPAMIRREDMRNEGGRLVMVGFVEMYYRTSQRMLVINIPDKMDVLFNIKLGSKPTHSKEFGAWQRADYIGEPGKTQTRKPTAAENYEIRYRADWPGES